jgi:hypothetical protein
MREFDALPADRRTPTNRAGDSVTREKGRAIPFVVSNQEPPETDKVDELLTVLAAEQAEEERGHGPGAREGLGSKPMQPFKAQVHNGRLVLNEPTDLPEGKVVELLPIDDVLAGGGDYLNDEERAGAAPLDRGGHRGFRERRHRGRFRVPCSTEGTPRL